MPFIEAPNFELAKTCRLCMHSCISDCEVPYCSKWDFYFSFIDWRDMICASFERKDGDE